MVLDGRYRLLRKVGEGGMGEVWEAQHTGLDRRLAIKLLLTSAYAKPAIRERFVREAQIVSRIEHPNVVEVSDFGELPDGMPFIAMELVQGRSLAAVLSSEAPLAWPRAVALARQIARGVGAAHREGVVHRDLKPGNVLVHGDDQERIKVIDFGIAKRNELDANASALTSTGAVFGTPGYMAPEQIRGDPADARADVYALGCILFEALSGRRVFEGKLFERLQAHLFQAPPALPETVPLTLREVVRSCLHKDPMQRFATMDAVAKALDKAVGAPSKRTAIVQGHVPVLPSGQLELPAPSGNARSGRTIVSTVPLTSPSPSPRSSNNRRVVWIVGAVALVATLAVLVVLRPDAPSTSSPAPSAAPNEKPTLDKPTLDEPTPASVGTPDAAAGKPDASAAALPVEIAQPRAPSDSESAKVPLPSSEPDKTPKKKRKRRHVEPAPPPSEPKPPPSEPEPTPKPSKPTRRDDGTFDLFPD